MQSIILKKTLLPIYYFNFIKLKFFLLILLENQNLPSKIIIKKLKT